MKSPCPIALLGLLVAGCTGTQPPPAAPGRQPIGLQLQQQDDSLSGQRFRTLLDFEQNDDVVFVTAPADIAVGGHTGASCVRVAAPSSTIKIGSLLYGSKLPGGWTLIGAYVRPDSTTEMRAALLDGDLVIGSSVRTVAAGQWAFLSVDLTDPTVAGHAADATNLRLRIEGRNLSQMDVDDVLLVDNSRTLLDTRNQGTIGWQISRKGYTTTIDAPGRLKVTVTAAAASDKGWVLQEYSSLRARLQSAGPIKQWTLYSDGRSIQDGRFDARGVAVEAADSHNTPGDATVDEATGKLDRNTDGDSNNDGYNEVRGAYQIVATAPRVQVQLKPAGVPLTIPILEVVGLPRGEVTVMVEGQLIDQTARLADGRVLVRLPLRIERPTIVTIKASDKPS